MLVQNIEPKYCTHLQPARFVDFYVASRAVEVVLRVTVYLHQVIRFRKSNLNALLVVVFPMSSGGLLPSIAAKIRFTTTKTGKELLASIEEKQRVVDDTDGLRDLRNLMKER